VYTSFQRNRPSLLKILPPICPPYVGICTPTHPSAHLFPRSPTALPSPAGREGRHENGANISDSHTLCRNIPLANIHLSPGHLSSLRSHSLPPPPTSSLPPSFPPSLLPSLPPSFPALTPLQLLTTVSTVQYLTHSLLYLIYQLSTILFISKYLVR
jgi:hypothetical protein